MALVSVWTCIILLLGASAHVVGGSATSVEAESALWPGEHLKAGKSDVKRESSGKHNKDGIDKPAFKACGKASLADVVKLFSKALKMAPLMRLICYHTATKRKRVEAKLRWAQASAELLEAESQLKKRLAKDMFPFSAKGLDERSNAWTQFYAWVNDLALQSDMHEVRALAALTQEALFWETMSVRSQSIELHWLLQNVWSVVDSYCRAGRFDDAKRAFSSHLRIEWPASGRYPIKYFFDTEDYRYVSQGPEPRLRVLPVPISLDTDDKSMQLLPDAVIQRLKDEWQTLAEEAKAASHMLGRGDKKKGDAYPTIATGGQWTKLDIYDINGWRQDLCDSTLKRLCEILRGSLRSESAKGKEWASQRLIAANDETIGLFAVRAGGWASLHSGQDRRVNVHICLLNCNNSRVVVAGTNIPYHDGSLFAFEDRAQHEVLNEGPIGEGDRINLVIGVLHPDFVPDKSARRGQGMRLDWWMAQLSEGLSPEPQILRQVFFEALHAQDVDALQHLISLGLEVQKPPLQQFRPLHEAVAVGHVRIAEALLQKRADVRAAAPGEPLHYAAHTGHAAMVKLLLLHKADPAPKVGGGIGSPLELAKSQGHVAVAKLLSQHAKRNAGATEL